MIAYMFYHTDASLGRGRAGCVGAGGVYNGMCEIGSYAPTMLLGGR